MKLGFIRLGHLSAGMAVNVVNAAYDVSASNRSDWKAGWLVELGAHKVTSVAADAPQTPSAHPG